jgi:hypothetical protein
MQCPYRCFNFAGYLIHDPNRFFGVFLVTKLQLGLKLTSAHRIRLSHNKTVWIDKVEYYISDIGKILGIFLEPLQLILGH